jgi:pSer/pThr/pTyr-binding forkhead associated (FHA) protein
VCRYDFEARTPGPPPVVEATASSRAAWDVTITVDPSLDVDPEPGTGPPADSAARTFPLDLTDMLIGRRDDRHDIRPEIPILDPAVSRRHARLLQLPDGGLELVDLASANGTAVNGTEVPAGVHHVLADGDSITMGRWTRLVVHRR